MSLRDFFDHYILNFAILWNFSDFYMGEHLASFLGLPVVLFGRLIYFFSVDLFYTLLISCFIIIFFVTFVGLKVMPTERFNQLILPRISGFMISLFLVKTKLINLFLLGLLYNVLYTFIFKYLVAKDSINYHLKDPLGLTFFWEKYLLLFTAAFSTGIATNICFHLLRLFSFIF